MAVRQIREILIKVAGEGIAEIKKAANSMGLLGKEVKKSSDAFLGLRDIAFGFLSGFGVTQLASIADEMLLLSNRINAFEGSAEKGREVLGGLNQIAKESKTSIDGLATTYFRLAASTKETGISTELLLESTKALQDTFRLSGATVNEATAVAIQISQGLASGQLRGQELRSVLEQNVVLGGLLAKTMGVTRGELYKISQEGNLGASQVFKVLLRNSKELGVEANKLGQTFGQTVTVALNDFKLALLDIVVKNDLTGKFASGVALISNNVDVLLITLTTLAATAIPALSKAIIALFASTGPVGLAFAGLGLVFGVVITNTESLSKAFDKLSSTSTNLSNRTGIVDVTEQLNEYAKTVNEVNNSPLKPLEMPVNFDLFGKATVNKNFKNSNNLSEQFIAEQEAIEKRKKLEEELKKMGPLEILNRDYLRKNDVAEYFSKIETAKLADLNKKFRDGKIDLAQYISEAEKLREIELTKNFNSGAISFSKFNEEINNSKIRKLTSDLDAGAISINKYRAEVVKLKNDFNLLDDSSSVLAAGATEYLGTIKSVAEQSVSLVSGAFKSLEDSLTKSLVKGKLDLQAFADFVVEEIARIFVRTNITTPLAGFLGGIDFTGTASAGAASGSAAGGAASTPAMFGKTGAYGLSSGFSKASESSNMSDSIVNINNYSNSEVSVNEQTGPNGERILDVMIQAKVKEAFNNGILDKSMSQNFGIKRRGE